MALSVQQAFERFKSNLEITELQQSTVSGRQQAVRDSVARSFSVIDSFLTGSYRRHTMIGPLQNADIDIFIVLDSSYYTPDGHAALLDQVRRSLLVTYPTTPRISRNGQAVTITFNDFVVDVVPAFRRTAGGFLIPSSAERRWIETDPTVHVTFMSAANRAHRGNLVPLIKMVKAWNRANGAPLSSFYLELMIEKVLRGITINDFPSGCRFVFDKAREQVKYTMVDPAGLGGGQVRGLVGTTTVRDAVGRVDIAYARAIYAEDLSSNGRVAQALGEWRAVFGNCFSAYG
jgi:hypothetical protein